jgi:hypothetical protein
MARSGAVDVMLSWRPKAGVVFEVLDGATSSPLTDLEVRAGHRHMVALTDPDGRIRRDFPGGRVRIESLFATSERESIEVVVRAPGYREARVAGLRPIEGQDLDLGVLRLWR